MCPVWVPALVDKVPSSLSLLDSQLKGKRKRGVRAAKIRGAKNGLNTLQIFQITATAPMSRWVQSKRSGSFQIMPHLFLPSKAQLCFHVFNLFIFNSDTSAHSLALSTFSPLPPLFFLATHTFTQQLPRRWRRSPYCLLPRAAGSAGRTRRSCAGRVGQAAAAGSASFGRPPAGAAASAGWPAAARLPSPRPSASWGGHREEDKVHIKEDVRPLKESRHIQVYSAGIFRCTKWK